jgi:hypothetical protein
MQSLLSLERETFLLFFLSLTYRHESDVYMHD